MSMIFTRSNVYVARGIAWSHATNGNSCCDTSCHACNHQGVDFGSQYHDTHVWCMVGRAQADDLTDSRACSKLCHICTVPCGHRSV